MCDYPAPLLALDAAGIDLSRAYGTHIGRWDEISITWGYCQFPPGTTPAEEQAGLDRILETRRARGGALHARAAGRHGGKRRASRKAITGIPAPMRRTNCCACSKSAPCALARFGEHAIKPGRPMALARRRAGAALSAAPLPDRSGGEAHRRPEFRYAMRGDGQLVTRMVPRRRSAPRAGRRARDHHARRAHPARGAAADPAAAPAGVRPHRATPSAAIPARPSTRSAPPKAPPPTASPCCCIRIAPAGWWNTTSATRPCPACTRCWTRCSTRSGALPPHGLAQAVKLRVEHVALRHLLALGASRHASPLVRAIVADTLAGCGTRWRACRGRRCGDPAATAGRRWPKSTPSRPIPHCSASRAHYSRRRGRRSDERPDGRHSRRGRCCR